MFLLMLVIAWFLTWFDFDALFIKGFNELTSKNISIAGYYIIFFLIGILIDVISELRK